MKLTVISKSLIQKWTRENGRFSKSQTRNVQIRIITDDIRPSIRRFNWDLTIVVPRSHACPIEIEGRLLSRIPFTKKEARWIYRDASGHWQEQLCKGPGLAAGNKRTITIQRVLRRVWCYCRDWSRFSESADLSRHRVGWRGWKLLDFSSSKFDKFEVNRTMWTLII